MDLISSLAQMLVFIDSLLFLHEFIVHARRHGLSVTPAYMRPLEATYDRA